MNKDVFPLVCGALAFATLSVLFVLFMAEEGSEIFFTYGLTCGFIGWFGRAIFERFAYGENHDG